MKFSLIGLLAATAPSVAWSFVGPKIQASSPTKLFMADDAEEEIVMNKFSR
jgi:hypothetical protein